MALATLTSKGQMTIPKDVRDKLKLKPGDRVDIQVEPDGTARLLPKTVRLRSLFGSLRRPGGRTVTIEEMNEAIAKHVTDHVMGSLKRRSR
jgi:AbrB family looped-hinge helix DNA binding protein